MPRDELLLFSVPFLSSAVKASSCLRRLRQGSCPALMPPSAGGYRHSYHNCREDMGCVDTHRLSGQPLYRGIRELQVNFR